MTEVEKQAARYRWLRDKSSPNLCPFYLSVTGEYHKVGIAPETVDATIDLMIEAEKKHDYPACAVFRGGKCTCD